MIDNECLELVMPNFCNDYLTMIKDVVNEDDVNGWDNLIRWKYQEKWHLSFVAHYDNYNDSVQIQWKIHSKLFLEPGLSVRMFESIQNIHLFQEEDTDISEFIKVFPQLSDFFSTKNLAIMTTNLRRLDRPRVIKSAQQIEVLHIEKV